MTKADLDNHVAVFAFDLLYLNDEPLLLKTLEERRELLRTTFKETKGNFYFAQSTATQFFKKRFLFFKLESEVM